MSEESTAPISEEEFVFRAIRRLRKPPYRGIHTVYIRPVKGGVMVYLPDDAPSAPKSVLQKILGPEEERG
jgi:hypothetical protein